MFLSSVRKGLLYVAQASRMRVSLGKDTCFPESVSKETKEEAKQGEQGGEHLGRCSSLKIHKEMKISGTCIRTNKQSRKERKVNRLEIIAPKNILFP